MISKGLFLLLFLNLSFATAQTRTVNGSNDKLAIMSADSLQSAKKEYEKNGLSTPSLNWIISAADKVLKKPLLSVVDKKGNTPSRDKHDFMSLNPNIWPDPNNAGCYVYKDGQWNHENDFHEMYPDRGKFNSLKKWVSTTAMAYHITDDEKFANKASQLLRAWFIDSKTRMNPNLNFAYAWPCKEGQENGWASGIVELQQLYMILDSVYLINRSPSWTESDQEQLRLWAKDMVGWLQNSHFGKLHDASESNHGVHHDVFASQLYLFSKNRKAARLIINRAKEKRIKKQIEPDGSMPRELKRATSLHYSAYNVEAFFYLARIGDKVGVDLWNYETIDGRGIKKALDFISESAVGLKTWKYPQIKTYDPHHFFGFILLMANNVYSGDQYKKLFRHLDQKKFEDSEPRFHMIFP